MRIAIFSESYEPIINGVTVSVGTLRDELTKRGHDVFIFAPAFRDHKDSKENVFRFPSTHTPLMRDYPFPIPFSHEIREKFASLKIDIVHTQTPFLLGVLGARWARRYGTCLVSTNHTLYTEYAHYVPIRPKAATRSFLIQFMRWYYSGCDAVVVPSSPVEKMLRSYGVRTRVEVIKTGVVGIPAPKDGEKALVRQRYGIGENDFLLLYVGRIAREKNLTMLLNAFKTVANSHNNAKLLLVGGGPAMDETRHCAGELGLTDRVIFAGMLNRKAIEPIYGSADAFAFPSTTETQGIAICEALSAGLPVVAVNAGGIPENVQPGIDGFLTKESPKEFADRIAFLLTHEDERHQMGEHARINAHNFSIERMVDDFELFYQSVIDAKLSHSNV
ncbi:MAG: glycosyltransferase family 4 protein [Armatimonadota bacterium]